LDRFLKILVDEHDRTVAVSEEFANNATQKTRSGGLLFDRQVARVITPGTLVDEKFMDPQRNNFLLALHTVEQPLEIGSKPRECTTAASIADLYQDCMIGLAWLDLSTGEFFTQSTPLEDLASALVRIGPREIVLHNTLEQQLKETILHVVKSIGILVAWQSSPISTKSSDWSPMLESTESAHAYGTGASFEVAAGSVLLEYVKDRLMGSGLKLQGPIRYLADESMRIDKNTMKGLELLETSREAIAGGKGSLLHTIRRTVTKSGARLLRQRLTAPSASIKIINERLDCVEYLLIRRPLKESITALLKRTVDTQRVVQKFSLGRGDADDLLDIQKTITYTQEIADFLSSSSDNTTPYNNALQRLSRRIELIEVHVLACKITSAIDEEGLSARHRAEQTDNTVVVIADEAIHEPFKNHDIPKMHSSTASTKAPEPDSTDSQPWIMKRSASRVLTTLHRHLDTLSEEKKELADALRRRLGAPSLTLRWTPALGHVCHVRGPRDVKASRHNLPSIRSVSSSKSTMSFYEKDWSDLGARIDQVKLHISSEEQNVFRCLRDEVVKNLAVLRRNAKVLDELDVACSFATLAGEQNLVRPIVNDSSSHHIVAGRHPAVDVGLGEKGRTFVANDCYIGGKERIWLITGPNMAGKSTFLRQNALISVLAQVGGYVPAAYAEIGIVDRLFSRIGAADNLYQDQSTFMVEMLETASILKSATSKSFVIVDEVGRGTTPEDGLAIAYACLHHLYHVNQCRTLFATHFHRLADLTQEWVSLGTYCNDAIKDDNGGFSFVHLLRAGVNRTSHALTVAQLAGMTNARAMYENINTDLYRCATCYHRDS
jgi:DNA mismatch repair ATPase MutS